MSSRGRGWLEVQAAGTVRMELLCAPAGGPRGSQLRVLAASKVSLGLRRPLWPDPKVARSATCGRVTECQRLGSHSCKEAI